MKKMTAKTPENKKNEEELIYTLARLNRVLSKIMLNNAMEENLTPQQRGILMILTRKNSIPMNWLGRALLVTPPNITSIIDRMEKKSYVKRVEDPNDRRKTAIQLTAKGKQLIETANERYKERIKESLAILTPREQEMLLQLLSKLEKEISKREFPDNIDI